MKHDWGALIEEFELRALRNSSSRGRPPPPGVHLGEEEQRTHELLPSVESGAMAGMVMAMWNVGKILRLDSFLLMFYPIPIFYVTLRWGPAISLGEQPRFLVGDGFTPFRHLGHQVCSAHVGVISSLVLTTCAACFLGHIYSNRRASWASPLHWGGGQHELCYTNGYHPRGEALLVLRARGYK